MLGLAFNLMLQKESNVQAQALDPACVAEAMLDPADGGHDESI